MKDYMMLVGSWEDDKVFAWGNRPKVGRSDARREEGRKGGRKGGRTGGKRGKRRAPTLQLEVVKRELEMEET